MSTVGTLAFSVAIAILYRDGRLQIWFEHWLQKRVIARVIRAIQPSLPFKIEKFDVDTRWKHFKDGRIANLSTRLGWKELKLNLQGQLDLLPDGKEKWTALFTAHGDLEGRLPSYPDLLPKRVPFNLDLTAGLQVKWKVLNFRLEEIGLRFEPVLKSSEPLQIQIPEVHTDLKHPTLRMGSPELTWEWRDRKLSDERAEGHSKLNLKTGLVSMNWTKNQEGKKIDSEASLASLTVNIEGPLSLSEFQPQGDWDIELQSGDLELLWEDRYLSLPLSSGHLRTRVSSEGKAPNLLIRAKSSWYFTGSPRPWLSIGWLPEENTINWEIPAISIASIQNTLGDWPEMSPLRNYEIRSGRVSTNGSAKSLGAEGLVKLQGKLEVRDLSLRDSNSRLLAQGIEIEIPLAPFSTDASRVPLHTSRVEIEAKRLQWRGITARVPRHSIYLGKSAPNERNSEVALESGPFPLEISSLPLKIGSFHGRIPNPVDLISRSNEAAERTTDALDAPWILIDHLNLASWSPSPLSEKACLPRRWIPEMKLDIQLSDLFLNPSQIDPDGQITVALFGGKLEASNLGGYRLDSAVPEYDFSLDWDNLHLSQMARWIHFGGIDGILTGYAHDVVLQSWLPTRYHFNFDVKPDRSRKAIFTSRAMQNTVKILMGDATQSLPGVAQWLLFDWPSRMLGDYAIDFAGISATSKDGIIELNSHTPDAILKEENGTHFILHSSRFKIPIRSETHPVQIDAIAMSNFLRRVGEQIASLSQEKEEDSEEVKKTIDNERNENESALCPTPEF